MVLAIENVCNEKHGIGNSDINWLSEILAGIALAAGGYSAYNAADIAYKEWKMAKKYWKISKWWLDYYNDHFAPVEDQEIEEASALEYVEPQYEAARGRARASAWIAFKGKLRDSMRCTSRYCTGLRNDMLIEVSTAQANAVALADGLGYRNERAYTETRNDVIFQRKLETAKRGRNIAAEAPSFAKSAANIYGDLANQAWEGLQGAGYMLGYLSERNDTNYPKLYMGSTPESRTGQYNRGAVENANAEGVDLGPGRPNISKADYERLVAATS